jgi:predicted 3-demethylubiquinone-9 3-methyltransferase (glyoxalase superfamily)
MQKITPFLWFNDNAEEAVSYYISIFENSKKLSVSRYDEASAKASGRSAGSVLTVSFRLDGQTFNALNGGPHFKTNQSISFFVYCESENKIKKLYNRLVDGGVVMMPLDKYDWSPKYAWVQDKFGVSWQLDVEKINNSQKILPALLFANEKFDKVKEAVTFYTSVFPDSKIIFDAPFDKSAGLPDDTLLFAQFKLSDYLLNAMSGSTIKHDCDFNEAFSFVVNCKDQDEVDYYWNKLTEGGSEGQCGWLKDKFGVSWQIVPEILGNLLSGPNPKQSEKAMKALLEMKKLDIKTLENAYNK